MTLYYVARVQTNRIMTISLGIGTRLPVYATSMGRVLLASLPDKDMQDFINGLEIQKLTENTITDKEKID